MGGKKSESSSQGAVFSQPQLFLSPITSHGQDCGFLPVSSPIQDTRETSFPSPNLFQHSFRPYRALLAKWVPASLASGLLGTPKTLRYVIVSPLAAPSLLALLDLSSFKIEAEPLTPRVYRQLESRDITTPLVQRHLPFLQWRSTLPIARADAGALPPPAGSRDYAERP